MTGPSKIPVRRLPAHSPLEQPAERETGVGAGGASTSALRKPSFGMAASKTTQARARSVSSSTDAARNRAKRLPLSSVSSNLPSRPAASGPKVAPTPATRGAATGAATRGKPHRALPPPRAVSGGTRSVSSTTSRSSSSTAEDSDRVEALEEQMGRLLMRYEEDRLRNEQELKELKEQWSNGSLPSTSTMGAGASVGELQLQAQIDALRDSHSRDRRNWDDQMQRMRVDAADAVDRERRTVSKLQSSLAEQAAGQLALETQVGALRAQAEGLRSDLARESDSVRSLQKLLSDAQASIESKEEELRAAESLRRKLHNEVQELRGNIRVIARVRPAVQASSKNGVVGSALADMRYPEAFPREGREVQLIAAGESASGTPTSVQHAFAFDRVLPPHATQADVFTEVEHLAQSVLDGYNTCIFAYGQTGSGKTYTLEGPPREGPSTMIISTDPSAGLIPRTVDMLWSVADQLKARGWAYSFSGQMVEIYLDGIIDLLSSGSDDPASGIGRHEIRHDAQNGRTSVVGAEVVGLHNPEEVMSLLARAQAKRQVAATAMNARSSRSHSVFTLSVTGKNVSTGEKTEAVLNLVDLAGSERLSNSGSADDPARLREAQSINKSLSALGDVIAALGKLGSRITKAEQHVPYRNSTLTWLLKNSLGGNSKTYVANSLTYSKRRRNDLILTLHCALTDSCSSICLHCLSTRMKRSARFALPLKSMRRRLGRRAEHCVLRRSRLLRCLDSVSLCLPRSLSLPCLYMSVTFMRVVCLCRCSCWSWAFHARNAPER